MAKPAQKKSRDISEVVKEFSSAAGPFASSDQLFLYTDARTGAQYCECHVMAKKLIELGTTDGPLDPKKSPQFRANRPLVDHVAFDRMKDDAKRGRSFSNIVAEFTKEFIPEFPLKIIGGQHRFIAIKEAFQSGINKYHGVKVYMTLTKTQRFDVQLISNTNIEVSRDLADRMYETVRGPELREWCEAVGLLGPTEDFTAKQKRGGPISVQMTRTFITNYLAGRSINSEDFKNRETTPIKCPKGQADPEWEGLLKENGGMARMVKDVNLLAAGKEFNALVLAQRKAFAGHKTKADFPEKATSLAVLAAWAYIAGVLENNSTRLKRHYDLKLQMNRDPLNAAALAKGRHSTDPENYRGLGSRSDPKELGILAELFFYQAEKGNGIYKSSIDIAISEYFAKKAQLEAKKIRAAAEGQSN